jgi:DNA-binding MarR family transcriptional regulator
MVGQGSCGPHSLGKLLAHISKYTMKYMSENLEEYGLTGYTYGYLMVLFHKDGLSEKELTEHMLVDKATTTRAISKLEEIGYIRKERDLNDKRAQRIFLTQNAEDLRPIMDHLKKEWTEIVLGELEDDERKTLLDILTRIESKLQHEMRGKGGQ